MWSSLHVTILGCCLVTALSCAAAAPVGEVLKLILDRDSQYCCEVFYKSFKGF